MNPILGGGNLEQRLAKLESAIKVGPDGSVTIESNTKIKIKGAVAIEIESGGSLVVKGTSTIDIQVGGPLTLKSSAQTNIQGSVIKLNGGGQPVVRVGDSVITPVGPGTILGGNPTVLG
jgi:hypothetical protein